MKKILFLFLFLISVYIVNACEVGEVDITNQKYCDINGLWQPLKNIGDCDNNFECKSSLCYESECAERSVTEQYSEQKSLLDKILALLSGKDCLTIGEIDTTSKKYCDSSYKLQTLKYGGSLCTNNYECLSNDCASGTCTCSSDNDCDADSNCISKVCVEIECALDIDCNPGFFCDTNGICKLKPNNCVSDADCTQGVCKTTTNTCVECLANSNCSPDKECKDNACVTVSTPPITSTSSSSGSRSHTSSQGNSYFFEKTFSKINPNKLYSFSINELPIYITKISFITNKALSNVKFIVKRMTEKGSDIPAPQGLIYAYFQLTTQNMQDADLEKAEIMFRVAKSWLTQNNLKQYKITLQRYTTIWTQTKPQMIAEDSQYYYYTTLTPGFSWFAITSIPEKPTVYYTPAQKQVQPKCGDGIVDINEDCNTCAQDVPCLENEVCSSGVCIQKKKTSILWFITPPIIIILIIVAIILYKKYKKPQKPAQLIRPINTVKYYRK